MNIDSNKWADRVYRPPKTGADYTSVTGNREQDQDDSTAETKLAPVTDPSAINRLRAQISDMHLVIQLLEQRIDRLEAPDVQQTVLDMERKLRLVQTLVLIIAGLLAFFMIREALVVLDIDIISILSNIGGGSFEHKP